MHSAALSLSFLAPRFSAPPLSLSLYLSLGSLFCPLLWFLCSSRRRRQRMRQRRRRQKPICILEIEQKAPMKERVGGRGGGETTGGSRVHGGLIIRRIAFYLLIPLRKPEELPSVPSTCWKQKENRTTEYSRGQSCVSDIFASTAAGKIIAPKDLFKVNQMMSLPYKIITK